MAAYHREPAAEVREYANCGAVEGLLKCSRCRQSWFCSAKCQKAYWPFHKPECTKNEFADAVEEKEPKFAAWMRKHGKLAVLKDDEVDRLERAAASTSGQSRQEVMDSLYGRLMPSPKEPSYTAEERIGMRSADEDARTQARFLSDRQKAWGDIQIDTQLGMDCEHLKWQQNQTYVEIYALLPARIQPSQVDVDVQPGHLRVAMDGVPLLNGPLLHEVKQDESTWYIQDGILHISLLKRSRRGNYADGTSNAHTFWCSILKQQPPAECIALQRPPLAYYNSYWEADKSDDKVKTVRRARPMLQPAAC